MTITKLTFGSNCVQNVCVVLLIVLPLTPPLRMQRYYKSLNVQRKIEIFLMLKRYELIC